MGNTKSKYFEERDPDDEIERAKRLVDEHGVVAAQELVRKELDGWRNVKIKIGVTGNAGVGKSTFINSFRGIGDEDENSAVTDVVEVELPKPQLYSYPGNENIVLVDLPGIGTPTYPDLNIYCKKVGLESYDTFLILTASRFTQLELELAQKIELMGKSFFLIRTKIDIDEMNDKRKKSHNTEEMLKKIKEYCQRSVNDLGIREDEVFLVSNLETSQWDFERLVDAILAKLPTHQKEALTLSLRTTSKRILKEKVKSLKGKAWMVTLLFIPAVPLDLVSGNFVSQLINWAEIKRRIKEYRSHLGLPEEDSDAFQMMNQKLQEEMKEFYPKENNNFWGKYFGCLFELPVVFTVVEAIETKSCLHNILNGMENMAVKILDDSVAINPEDQMEQ